MRKLLLFILLFVFTSIFAQPLPPKREFRGVWIATVLNLDWPSSRGLSAGAQRQELIRIFDELQSAGVNAVLFQIRSECDAMYASTLEPWSYWLTGQQGVPPSPFYDPLEFAIAEAHQRGIELHAWFNPYRSVREVGNYSIHPNHVSVKHPDWILTFTRVNFKLLDPGLPQVRQHVTNIVIDVVRRYDVDGVHFDDYFYPYPDNAKGFPGITTEDNATFAQHHRGFTNRFDWRRDNVNLLVKMVHDSIQVFKPYVKFGISPFGVRKNSDAGTSGLDAYSTIYCDAVAWLNARTVDYLTPQIYWAFARTAVPYGTLVPWWASVMNGLHLYVGHGAHNMENSTQFPFPVKSWPASELVNQIQFNRKQKNVEGSVFFRAQYITSNLKGFADSLKNNLYRYPGLSPIMAWKDSVPPNIPQNLRYDRIAGTGTAELRWETPSPAGDGNTASRYVVYRFNKATVTPADRDDPSKIVAIVGSRSIRPKTPPANNAYYAVTALDRISNESGLSSVLSVSPPAIPLLALPFNGAPDQSESVTLRWHYPPLAASYQLQISSDSTFAAPLVVNETGVVDTFKVIAGLEGQKTYYWRVKAANAGGVSNWSAIWRFKTIDLTGVDEKPSVPATFALYQNYPNPFNPMTAIIFDLPKPGTPELVIYDALGQEVLVLLDEPKPAGRHEVYFYAYDFPSGIYYYRLKFDGQVLTRRMTILK